MRVSAFLSDWSRDAGRRSPATCTHSKCTRRRPTRVRQLSQINSPSNEAYLSLAFGVSIHTREPLSRAQFAAVVQADEKWVENTARTLCHQLAYSPLEARWMGPVRLLTRDVGIPAVRAAELANEALQHSPETRALSLVASSDSPVAVVLDLARYHSTFAAALSTATHHGGPRRRGRPSVRKRARRYDAVAAAQAHGVDVSLLRQALDRSPAERLARLDANSQFLRGLRRAR